MLPSIRGMIRRVSRSASRLPHRRQVGSNRVAARPILSTAAVVPLVHWVRHEKVLLDFDLSDLYGVETRALKQAVRRNRDRFPGDFMFELTEAEARTLVSQSVIPTLGKLGGARPFAFTEGGVAMLSSVLRSRRAVQVNIAIMRTFSQLARLMDSNPELARRIDLLEKRYDEQFASVFEAIRRLIATDETRPRRSIGFRSQGRSDAADSPVR
jgi:hypothetical protein